MKLSDLKWILLRYRRSCRKRLFGRHRLNHKVIALDITYGCNLKCFNCNRSCRQAPSDETMAVQQVEKFIAETVAQNRTWKEIKLEGGEPTLHPDFFEVIELMREFKASRAPGTIISLSTNGYGEEVRSVLAQLPKEIVVYNSGKDSPVRDEFYAFNVAPADLAGYQNSDFTQACDIPYYFGIGLSPYGYYPCTVSAGIDRVFGMDIGKKRLPGKDDPMTEQLQTFCRLCGHCIPFNLAGGKELISPTWVSAYNAYQIEAPRLTLY
jgi:hypothetical protein